MSDKRNWDRSMYADFSLCEVCAKLSECPERTERRDDMIKCVISCKNHSPVEREYVRDKDPDRCEETGIYQVDVKESYIKKPNLCKLCIKADQCLMYRLLRHRKYKLSGYIKCYSYLGPLPPSNAEPVEIHE